MTRRATTLRHSRLRWWVNAPNRYRTSEGSILTLPPLLIIAGPRLRPRQPSLTTLQIKLIEGIDQVIKLVLGLGDAIGLAFFQLIVDSNRVAAR